MNDGTSTQGFTKATSNINETLISDVNQESQNFKLKYISTKPELENLETVG